MQVHFTSRTPIYQSAARIAVTR